MYRFLHSLLITLFLIGIILIPLKDVFAISPGNPSNVGGAVIASPDDFFSADNFKNATVGGFYGQGENLIWNGEGFVSAVADAGSDAFGEDGFADSFFSFEEIERKSKNFVCPHRLYLENTEGSRGESALKLRDDLPGPLKILSLIANDSSKTLFIDKYTKLRAPDDTLSTQRMCIRGFSWQSGSSKKYSVKACNVPTISMNPLDLASKLNGDLTGHGAVTCVQQIVEGHSDYDPNKQEIRLCRRYLMGMEFCTDLEAGERVFFLETKFVARREGSSLCVYNEPNPLFEFTEETAHAVAGAATAGVSTAVGGLVGFKMFDKNLVGCWDTDPCAPGKQCLDSIPLMHDNAGNLVPFPAGKQIGSLCSREIVAWDNDPCFTGACFIAPSCYSSGYRQTIRESRWSNPMTSLVAQCVTDTLKNIFVEPQAGVKNTSRCQGRTLFQAFQLMFKRIIIAAFVLYFIFTGIGIVMAHRVPGMTEFVWAAIKFGLVMYFALGDGWKEYFPALLILANELALYIVDAGNLHSYCQFNPSDYNTGYGMLALWDTLDCKIQHYFNFGWGSAMHQFDGGASNWSNYVPPLVLMNILHWFLSWGFLPFLLGISFFFIMILFLVYTVHTYLISMLAMSLLVFISPIMVPMALFSATQEWFKSWLDELLSYTIYPVILFGFLALMLATFDNIMLGTTIFNPDGTLTKTHIGEAGTVEDGCDPKALLCILGDIYYHEKDLMFGWTIVKTVFEGSYFVTGLGDLVVPLAKACLFGLLFWQFVAVLGSFAAELAGSHRSDPSSLAVKPGELMHKAAGVAKKAIDMKTGGAASAASGGKDGGSTPR